MRQAFAVGCLLVGVLIGCGDEGAQTVDSSTTQVADESWFAFRPVVATREPPCDNGTTPSTDSSACFELGEQIIDAGGVVAAAATEYEDFDCPAEEVICHIETSPTSATSRPGRTAWSVGLTLSADGLRAFNDAAEQCYLRAPQCPRGQIAIVIDGRVVSAPQIQQPEFESDAFQIADDQAEADARDLASRFN